MSCYRQNWIDGEWIDGGAGWLAVDDPATDEPVFEHACVDAGDVAMAVASARAFHERGSLTRMRPLERGRLVQAMGHWIAERADVIAETLTREQGKPLWEAKNKVANACRYFEYYGNQAALVEGRSVPLGAGYLDYTALEPYGVSAQIIP